jgi:ABC-type Mn2+/Zn2+ transport system ATPase subunit
VTASSPCAVRATAVSAAYGGNLALDAISFELTAGTAAAVIGPNGSGKTTLLNLLAGLLQPSAGVLEVEVSPVAYVLQSTRAPRWMPLTVAEVLRMSRYRQRGLLGRISAADRALISDAAERLGVEGLLGRQFGELSGGQRQRVLVAQALAQRADLLLLDEPITGLDLASQARILEVVGEETARGVTVVLSTHHLEEAAVCDRVLVLDRRLVASGPPAEILTPELLAEAFGARAGPAAPHEGHAHPPSAVYDDHAHGVD